MIIVEGPDGAGKTTLISKLRVLTKLEVSPRVVSKDAESMVDLKRWTEENVRAGFQNLIFDRHRLISEPIYGPVLRKIPEPGFNDLEWFLDQITSFYLTRPVIIYCLPPFSVVWGNVMKDDDNKIFHAEGEKLSLIYRSYVNKAVTDHSLRSRTWIYDYTDPIYSEVMIDWMALQIKKVTR